jgi:hypothetical protein
MEYTRTLTPSLSHSMGEGARRAGEGRLVVYPGHSVVCFRNMHASPPECTEKAVRALFELE